MSNNSVNKNSVTTPCLVTGCAGFVGSWLCSALLRQGFPVLGVDNLQSGCLENMSDFIDNSNFTFYNRSVLEPALLQQLHATRPDIGCVFHLAALVSVPYSIDHADETMRLNHDAALAWHATAWRLGIKAFVFAGSAAEYGDAARLPLQEGDADRAGRLSPYSESKYLTSKAIEASGYGVSLRFFNIYGPRQDPASPYSGVMAKFIDAALSGNPCTIFGDGTQTRDFIYVEDAVEAYLLAAGLTRPGGKPLAGIYNVGTQTPVSIGELARLINEAAQTPCRSVHRERRAGDIRHSLADITRIANATGFAPQTDLVRGIARTMAWYRHACPSDNAVGVPGCMTP